jgi:hypothetical protein
MPVNGRSWGFNGLWHKDRDAMTYSYDLLRPG